jgi:hypothetical protein
MISNKVTAELLEAYNSIYLEKNIEENARKLAQILMDVFIEEGYDINEDDQVDFYEFCLTENPVQVTSLLSRMQRAKQVAQPALSYVAQRFRTGANLPAGSNIASQLTKRAIGGGAEVAGKVVKNIPKIPGALKDVITKPGQPLKKAGLVLTGMELSRALPQSPTQFALQKGSELLGWSAKQDPGAAAGETAGRLQKAGQALTTPTTKKPPQPKPEDEKKNAWAQLQSVDLFDLVKGHLLDEGYADTEEAALKIMVNMSEEWRESIIEQSAIAQRAASVVDDQRKGSHGMADDLNKTRKTLDKLKPYPNGFPNASGVKGV